MRLLGSGRIFFPATLPEGGTVSNPAQLLTTSRAVFKAEPLLLAAVQRCGGLLLADRCGWL